MQITFEQTGGFTGIPMTVTVDVDKLPPPEAQDFRQLVTTARFFELPELITTPVPGADRFSYTITVEAEGRTHCVTVSEGAVPEALRPLIQRLRGMARARRG
jgi:hypothetical protein